MTRLPHNGKRFDIVIAGETNLDLILYGLAEQMPLERELLASGFQMTLGGSSSILAHNLAVLGTRVGFVTQVGDDVFGDIALGRLQMSGADLAQVSRRPGEATGVTVLLAHGRTRHILTYLGVMTAMKVVDLDFDYLCAGRHLHLSSLFLQTGLHPGLPELFSDLRAAGLTVSLDTNDDPDNCWGGVLDALLDRIDILLPNEDEVKRITGKATLEQALDALAPRIPAIVVKCGSRGAVVQQGGTRTIVESQVVQPIDTIGAGDSFNAGFLHAFLEGKTMLEAAAFGNRAGVLSTLRAGGTEAFRDSKLVDELLRSQASGPLKDQSVTNVNN